MGDATAVCEHCGKTMVAGEPGVVLTPDTADVMVGPLHPECEDDYREAHDLPRPAPDGD